MNSTQRNHHPNCRSQCEFAHDRSQDVTSPYYDVRMCPYGHGDHECNCWDLQPGETLDKDQRQYTTTEAAAILGVRRVTVNQYIRRGQLKAEKRGRDLFISQDELERFQRERPKVGWVKGRPRTPPQEATKDEHA